jgi:hypothetical protein
MSERENLRLIDQLHTGESYSLSLLDSGLLTDSTEWWAAGPHEILPWAGSVRGREAIVRWFKVLNDMMEYDMFKPFETIAQGDSVIVLYHASGRARSTGRGFQSDIVRIYTMRNRKIVRVRNFYDTASYVAALRET